MIIRKSNIVSVCLLALATSISVFKFYRSNPTVLESIDADSDNNDACIENLDEEEQDLDEIEDDTKSDDNANIEQDKLNNNTVISNINPIQEHVQEHEVTMKKGDSLSSVLRHLGIVPSDIHNGAIAVAKIFKLKNIKAGQIITIRTSSKNGICILETFEFKPNFKFRICVERHGQNFVAKKVEIKLKKVIQNISGTISPKFPRCSLQQCGVKSNLAKETLKVLSQVTNISNARTPVDFRLVYEQFYDDEGNDVASSLLGITAVIDGKIRRIYKFKNNGVSEYVDSKGIILGNSNSKMMFMQPIAYKKISSYFGARKHPISGRIKGHTGIDFAANIGTPIKAAASGIISKASYYSGYGKYISISHGDNLKTAYGHLSKILVKKGQYVTQGQIIGHSGNSGNSTGPHLHYELIKNGKFINPLSYISCKPRRLTGRRLTQFNAFKHSINLRIASLPSKSIQRFI